MRHSILSLLLTFLLCAYHGALRAQDAVPADTRMPADTLVQASDTTGTDSTGILLHPRTPEASAPVPFEGYDPEVTRLRWQHAVPIGLALAGTVTAIHIYQQNAWWQDRRTSFHFTDDPDYALNVDKAGHVFGGAFGAFLGRKSLEFSGASRDASIIWGATLGALFELYVEFEDGFAPDWGFSPGDAIGDVIGAAWPVGQHYIPFMQSLQPKFTYYPSKKFRDGLHEGNAIDDYEGQTYWMGIRVHDFLPRAMQRWWPDWLGIAVGVAVRNMDTPAMERNVIIALDYDMVRLLPEGGWWWTTFKEALNHLHFPSPAIRISPNFIGYGLYF
jgi:hypothetical protein